VVCKNVLKKEPEAASATYTRYESPLIAGKTKMDCAKYEHRLSTWFPIWFSNMAFDIVC
jgi:hypothetical protein